MPTTRKNTQFIDDLNAEFGADADEGAAEPAAGEGSSSESFAALLGESLRKGGARKLSVGDRIKARILVLGKDDVFVSTGTQNDGIVPRLSLLDAQGKCPYQEGDTLELFVTLVRGTEIRLSPNPTDKNLAEDLEDAFDMMLPVQGRVVEICKGGVRVNLKGKLAFCPISQLDLNRTETGEEHVGRSYEFKITKFAEGGRNIVVSRRALLEEQREENAGAFFETNEDGGVVEGKVVRLEKFGAFVEVAPGVDGLVHVSEIAWSRVGDPADVLTVGQEVLVKILKRETLGDRVKLSLSIRQAMPPEGSVAFEDAASANASEPARRAAAAAAAKLNDPMAKWAVGTMVVGKITRKEPYGLFVQLEPGATGLLHQSKFSDRPDFKFDKLKVGDEVTVRVGEIKASERKISLDLPADPNEGDWREHQQKQATVASSFGGAFGNSLKAALEGKAKRK